MRDELRWGKRMDDANLEQIWDKFAPCLVEPKLQAIYRRCHDYFREEVF